jgi:P4 family phage/plasmid primase-like protien
MHPTPGASPLPSPALVDPAEVRRALQMLAPPGQVTELRILSAKTTEAPRYAYQASGYFNATEVLIKALASLRSAKGVYITLHPCNPALLARAQNRLRTAEEMRQNPATSDQHITHLRWLLIDLDPERPAGISSNHEEHQAALLRAQIIRAELAEEGWPEPVEADSGNGAHLLYPIDLPVEAGAKETGLLHRVLKGLAMRFDAATPEGVRVLVDQTVYNPSRICKLYGTLACKGDHTAERPHRMARILAVPPKLETVPRERLEAIAALAPIPEPPPTLRASGHSGAPFDLVYWIAEHQLDVYEPTDYQGGQRWIFRVCPWHAEHTDRSAFLIQYANGAIAAGCQHNSCQGKGWKDLRARFEPLYEQRAQRQETIIAPPAANGEVAEIPMPTGIEIDFVLDCLKREEEGDARLYARLFRGRCVYDHTDNLWYEWQGHSWKRDEQDHSLVLATGPLAAIYLDASATLSDQAAEEERRLGPLPTDQETSQAREHYTWLKSTTAALIKRARRLKTLRRANAVLAFARALLPINASAWDTDPWLLCTPNGVIDLRTGHLRPGQPGDYIRTIIPTHFQSLETPAPRFELFLREIFGDRAEAEREELIAFLQRVLGYGISGKVVEHMFLMLYGEEGRNGKDTLMSVLQAVLGATVGPVSNDVILANSKFVSPGSAKPHLCSLQGKRIAWASETDRGARFDVGQVKFLTGGGSIAARQLYGTDYTFEPSYLLVLLTNHKPHADSSDAAFWERLCPILFNLRFVEYPTQPNERQRDTKLGQALQAEAGGILAWLVRGCLQWQRDGLTVPASVRLARASYRGEEDTLGDFLQECCVTDEQAKVAASDLYFHYRVWAINNGLKYLNGRAFGMEMKKRVNWGRAQSGIFYEGLALLLNESEETGTQVVQGQSAYDKSLDAAQQAVSGQMGGRFGVGSVGNSQKPLYTNQAKTQKESLRNYPTLPTPDEFPENALPPTEEPREEAFPGAVPVDVVPTPPIAYEEFDL